MSYNASDSRRGDVMKKGYRSYTDSRANELIEPATDLESSANSKLIAELGPGAEALLDNTMGQVARDQLMRDLVRDRTFETAPVARRIDFNASGHRSLEDASTSDVRKRLAEPSFNNEYRLPKGPSF